MKQCEEVSYQPNTSHEHLCISRKAMFWRLFPCLICWNAERKVKLHWAVKWNQVLSRQAACSKMIWGLVGREQRNKTIYPARFSGIKQQGGLHRSAVTGQHPPLYGGKGVPVPAPFCNVREHKHGQTEVSRIRGKAEAVWMLSIWRGSCSMLLLKSNTILLVFIGLEIVI